MPAVAGALAPAAIALPPVAAAAAAAAPAAAAPAPAAAAPAPAAVSVALLAMAAALLGEVAAAIELRSDAKAFGAHVRGDASGVGASACESFARLVGGACDTAGEAARRLAPSVLGAAAGPMNASARHREQPVNLHLEHPGCGANDARAWPLLLSLACGGGSWLFFLLFFFFFFKVISEDGRFPTISATRLRPACSARWRNGWRFSASVLEVDVGEGELEVSSLEGSDFVAVGRCAAAHWHSESSEGSGGMSEGLSLLRLLVMETEFNVATRRFNRPTKPRESRRVKSSQVKSSQVIPFHHCWPPEHIR